MHRYLPEISFVIALSMAAFGGAGCEKTIDGAKSVLKAEAGSSSEAANASRPRVNSVANMGTAVIPPGWCSVKFDPGMGPKLALPETEMFNQGPTMVTGRPRWINMWATWCKPCIAEIPHILSWREARLGTGTDISLELLSVDEDLKTLQAFLARRPDLRTVKLQRMTNPGSLGEFAQSLGLGQDTTVPIHIFTDRQDNIVCVRTGGIADTDLGVIRELLK